MKVRGFAHSVVGGREQNQDAFLVWDERFLYAVADGVGGGLKGEVASKMAVDGLRDLGAGETDLKPVFENIQKQVLHEAMTTLGDALMGTTLTAVLVSAGKAHLCHVGDSRCYLLDQGCLRLLTVDHESFDEVLKVPVLCSYMGIPSDTHPLTILQETIPISPGQKLLLCSDGLYKQVSESRIAQVISGEGEPALAVETLCAEAARAPYSDNITIVLIEIVAEPA